jgi:hypothetical protein
MRFSMTVLLVIVTVIAVVLAALIVMASTPAVLFFVGLLCLMPALTVLVAAFGRGAWRAGGITATLFQLFFWLFFWSLESDGWFVSSLRESLYWYANLATNELSAGTEVKTWFVFVGILSTVGGLAGALIHRFWLQPRLVGEAHPTPHSEFHTPH